MALPKFILLAVSLSMRMVESLPSEADRKLEQQIHVKEPVEGGIIEPTERRSHVQAALAWANGYSKR